MKRSALRAARTHWRRSVLPTPRSTCCSPTSGSATCTGGELAQRALALRPGLAVVYASGQGSAQALRRGMPPGDAFLVKPFRAEDLESVLDGVFAGPG